MSDFRQSPKSGDPALDFESPEGLGPPSGPLSPPDFEMPPEFESPPDFEFEPPPELEVPPAPRPAADVSERPAMPAPSGASSGRARRRAVVFTLGALRCGVDAGQVVQVEIPGDVVPLPHAPDWMLGVTHVRGEILAVIDLRALLERSDPPGEHPRLVVVRTPQGAPAAVLVDRIVGVRGVGEELAPRDMAALDPALQPSFSGPFDVEGESLHLADLAALVEAASLESFDASA